MDIFAKFYISALMSLRVLAEPKIISMRRLLLVNLSASTPIIAIILIFNDIQHTIW